MQNIFEENKDVIIDPKTQKQLNKPLEDKSGFNEGHEDFLHMLIKKLENGEIDPHNVQTLYNKSVYDNLHEDEQEKADLAAVNLMSMIRQIERMHNESKKPTFQVQNLVESIFQAKSKFEEKHGNVYII